LGEGKTGTCYPKGKKSKEPSQSQPKIENQIQLGGPQKSGTKNFFEGEKLMRKGKKGVRNNTKKYELEGGKEKGRKE